MSLPRLAAQRPLVAVLCTCALIAVALLLVRAEAVAGEVASSSHAAFAAEPSAGPAEPAAGPAEDGEDDDAVAHPTVIPHLRDSGSPLCASAPHRAPATNDPPQSPPPEA